MIKTRRARTGRLVTVVTGLVASFVADTFTSFWVALLKSATVQAGSLKNSLSGLTFEDATLGANSPKEVCMLVQRSIRYREDLGDTWVTGKEAWERAFGGCEGFAACVVDMCRAVGIEARIEVFYPRGSREAHAVAMGTWQGKMWISSNGSHQYIASMEEAKRGIAGDLGWRRQEVLAMEPPQLSKYIRIAGARN